MKKIIIIPIIIIILTYIVSATTINNVTLGVNNKTLNITDTLELTEIIIYDNSITFDGINKSRSFNNTNNQSLLISFLRTNLSLYYDYNGVIYNNDGSLSSFLITTNNIVQLLPKTPGVISTSGGGASTTTKLSAEDLKIIKGFFSNDYSYLYQDSGFTPITPLFGYGFDLIIEDINYNILTLDADEKIILKQDIIIERENELFKCIVSNSSECLNYVVSELKIDVSEYIIIRESLIMRNSFTNDTAFRKVIDDYISKTSDLIGEFGGNTNLLENFNNLRRI